ncbi:hypothetical protein FAUST_7709 [Fusarium austroamericanum]|uniref:Uncharacterized protein n=1 Tax=Fusarium austroamericanum TaxID=282268 RepID=A0AAN6BYK4_FUSAU|nr:hypothetical protein FAUST_7709 [Fusarium austroamericanum]
MSSTCSDDTRAKTIDIHHTTKAIPKWEKEDTPQYLTKPDPKTSAITVISKFNSEAAFFDLAVPVKLKGLDTLTVVYLRICASTIISLHLVKNPNIPNSIREIFGTDVLSLDFTLKSPPSIIAQLGVPEPLRPERKSSGAAVDAISNLSKSTTLSICIAARDKPPQLRDVSAAVNQRRFESFNSAQHQIASRYGGIGGKLITSEPAPPTYDEAATSPPPPPPIEPSRKRPRQDSSTDTKHEGIALVWAEIRAINEFQHRVQAENSALRQQNRDLVNDMAKLKKDHDKLKKDHDELKKDHDELDTLHATLADKTKEFGDEYDAALMDLSDEVKNLDGAVMFLQQGQVGEEAKGDIMNAVVENIITRLVNG